jgi:iron(III) transport system substrate-binding protein
MQRRALGTLGGIGIAFFFHIQLAYGGEGKSAWQVEWERTLEAAKKEGTLVVGIPASAELRKQAGSRFTEKFGIPTELLPARGPENVTRIINESKAGVRYFDILVAGGATPLAMVREGVSEPFEPFMITPEVKDPKYWWGGHIWEDNVTGKRQVYAFQCYSSETFWYNTNLVNPGEIRSYDDLLNPKWKGKIAFLDPRNPGSGQNNWGLLWKVKGEDYLRRLAQQELFVSQNQRQMAESLVKGKLAISIGLSYYTFEPFTKAGLPVKPLTLKDANDASNGSGVVAIVKNPPHPHATKVFVNWLLSKEGQELYGRAMLQGTRRLDVDSRWLKQSGVEACKDSMTVEDYYRLETHLESSVLKVRAPAVELANKVLK